MPNNDEELRLLTFNIQIIRGGSTGGKLIIGEKTYDFVYEKEKDTGEMMANVAVRPFGDNAFSGPDRAGKLKNMLRLLAMEKKFNVADLFQYFGASTVIRQRQLEQVLNVPPYIATLILVTCIKMGALTSHGYHYRKSQTMLELLGAKYDVQSINTRRTFEPVPERAESEEEDSWEKWGMDDDNGLDLMEAERARIENDARLKNSVRKRLLKIADTWIRKKKDRVKALKPRQSEKERMKDVIAEEEREAAAFDTIEKKKKKKGGNHDQAVYDDEENSVEDPSLVRKHFRKKKVAAA